MSNIPITMLKIKRIIQLKIEGLSNREIAKSLKLSKNTVNDYVKCISPLFIGENPEMKLGHFRSFGG